MVQATTVRPPKVVRIIEPTIPIHETVKTTYRALRVAAYCRVSTKQEEQLHSYETQVKHYTERIQAENGWILEGIYADKGITGTSYKKRDEFNRMIRRCKQGKIDMIIVKSIARFARNTVDCLKFVRMLNDLNVVVYFEEQGSYSNQPGAEFYIPTGRKSSFLGIPYEVSDCYALKARVCPKCGKIELYADFGEKC